MRLETIWYGHHPVSHLLRPLSWLYRAVIWARCLAYRRHWLASHRLPVPVIVVGNLTVGGTGKTPLVIWLTSFLHERGIRPGVITRGYGGSAGEWPRLVLPDSDPFVVGDEPVLLARRSGCPVVAGPDRVAAGEMLMRAGGCDMIVTDDGLQHYRLHRDLEILVVDGARGFGNGYCLPAGPLREPASRRKDVDLVLCNGGGCPDGWVMSLIGERLFSLQDPSVTRELKSFRHTRVTAVAGIGNPDRFFTMLRKQGVQTEERPYRDHHRFTPEDAGTWPAGPVIMTEKDAVKCEGFAGSDHWYLTVEALMEADFEQRLLDRLVQMRILPWPQPGEPDNRSWSGAK